MANSLNLSYFVCLRSFQMLTVIECDMPVYISSNRIQRMPESLLPKVRPWQLRSHSSTALGFLPFVLNMGSWHAGGQGAKGQGSNFGNQFFSLI